jgi:hypothetical protein
MYRSRIAFNSSAFTASISSGFCSGSRLPELVELVGLLQVLAFEDEDCFEESAINVSLCFRASSCAFCFSSTIFCRFSIAIFALSSFERNFG